MPDLIFNVAQLLREGIGARRQYQFTEPELVIDADQRLSNLSGTARFTRTASGVLVAAQVSADLETFCARCLREVTTRLDVTFEDEFHSRIDVLTGHQLPNPQEEDPFFIDEQHMLDLGSTIREYALMNMPMQALCRAECKGLCPTCGADLNIAPCDCDIAPTDDRLAVLKQLLEGDTR